MTRLTSWIVVLVVAAWALAAAAVAPSCLTAPPEGATDQRHVRESPEGVGRPLQTVGSAHHRVAQRAQPTDLDRRRPPRSRSRRSESAQLHADARAHPGFFGPEWRGQDDDAAHDARHLPPDEGTISILGQGIADVRARIGYLPEERGLYKRMRADAAIAYIATLKGMKRPAALARARQLLEGFGLGTFARVRMKACPKAWRRRFNC